MSLIKEFKDFINKGNVIDLAVAVVIGKAFGDIVAVIVAGLIMPIVGKVLPSGQWQTWAVGGIQIGAIIAAIINFIIIAFVIFIVVQKFMKRARKPDAPAVPPPTPEDIVLLREIRDQLARR
jgi:large conductance mechanosensitive channel